RPLCPCLPAPLCSVSISFLTRYPPSRPPPAFPTRRSSDLQASQFGLTREVKLVTEILELENLKAVGEAMTGTIGSSRYPFTVDTPKNRDFVKRFHAMHGIYPDMFDGETYEGLEWLAQTIQKAGTADDVEKVIEAWEDSTYEGL